MGTTTVNWLLRRHLSEVLGIERDTFEYPWREEDFLLALRQRNCIGLVAERDDRVLGYMIYDFNRRVFTIVNLAVRSECRRQGVGLQLVAKVAGKLTWKRRGRLMAYVREQNLNAQLFFRGCGFRCVSTLPDYFEVPGGNWETAYAFAMTAGDWAERKERHEQLAQ